MVKFIEVSRIKIKLKTTLHWYKIHHVDIELDGQHYIQWREHTCNQYKEQWICSMWKIKICGTTNMSRKIKNKKPNYKV